jgi:predicted short-subunit dehydrogenase-like oxidoreductase (DUF2520 family)
MGQVPYGIVGDGRLAQHLKHYFKISGIAYRQWSRRLSAESGSSLADTLSECSYLLLAIKDAAIEATAENDILNILSSRADWRLIHFSGSLHVPFATSMHPLMTFGQTLYDLQDYEKIPFVCEEGGLDFKEVFPKLKNPHFILRQQDKALYHALCVMSGNFSVILWQKLFREFSEKFEIPASAAFPYLERITKNLEQDWKQALTGPLQRKDQQTIQRNLHALEGDPFQTIYQAFVAGTGATS